jgi:hypothetical protein
MGMCAVFEIPTFREDVSMYQSRFGRWQAALSCLASCAVLAVAHVIQAADQYAGPLRAGVAAANITPPLGEEIVGGFYPFPAENIHDELYARCLLLDDGRTQLALVVCDNVGIAREVFDAARTLIAQETKLPPENVLMCATHTHSATSARGANALAHDTELTNYPRFLARRMGDVVRLALFNLQPAKIGWGSVAEASPLNNRRWYVTNPDLRKSPFGGLDEVRMNPPAGAPELVRPAGPIDPEVSFLSVRTLDDKPIALLANYSLHYVGGVGKADISADYFGIFAERIGELLHAGPQGPRFVGMMTNGTSGDVNNINFREKPVSKPPYEKMAEVAELIAQRVAAAEKSIPYRDHATLGVLTQELTLQVRQPDAELTKYIDKVLAQPESAAKYHPLERIYAERARTLAAGPSEVTVLVQAFRIGDLGIAAIPFEVFTEIGLEIKERSPFADTFTISLANGSYGYLPTPAQHKLGGYETWLGTNKVQLDASERITEALLGMLGMLRGGP